MGKTFASTASDLERVFPGKSEMARRMRSLDWSATALGPPEFWPENLQIAVRLCLTSSFPILLWWGPQFVVLFNDDYLPFLSESKRTGALARPGGEVWRETWAMTAPMLESVAATGIARWSDQKPYFFDLDLQREEMFASFSYNPILSTDGRTVDGILCPFLDETAKVVGARRLETLRKLGARSGEARTIEAACQRAASALLDNPRDIAFAAIYVVSDGEARLTAAVPLGAAALLPAAVGGRDPDRIWPLAQVLRSKQAADCLDLEVKGVRIPGGAWSELTREAMVLPIPSETEELAGLLAIGASRRRPLDAEYRTFFELIASQIATAFADVRADEAKRASAEALAELAAMTRLHRLSTRLLENAALPALLRDVLDASIELLAADFGIVQLYDAASGGLRIVAQRGFDRTSLDYFDRAEVGSGARRANGPHARVVVEDIEVDPSFSSGREVMRAAECRAVQSTPLVNRDGELLGMLSTHFRRRHRPSERDLRLLDLYARQAAALIERRHAEEKLRRSEDRYRHYFELGLLGGALTTPDNRCLEVNDELCRILGFTREELVGRAWTELTHPDDIAADSVHFELALSGSIDSYTLDKRWIQKNGTVVDSITAARAVRRTDGSVEHFVGLVQDISARNRIEESRRRRQAELAQVARVTTMSEMASSIAHEVNQPLAAIMTNANACARWLALEPSDLHEANQAVARIAREAARASEVIARIRRFVERRGLQREPLDLGELARETLAMADADLRRHGVSTRLAAVDALPLAFGDRLQLQQVMLNLLRNAVEAMDLVCDRRRILEVLIDSYGTDALCVAVRDSGIGLDQAQRENVFDAFHTTKPTGMGMGLAISRSIIDAHGGRLWATPNVPHGETFRFTLPLEATAPDYD